MVRLNNRVLIDTNILIYMYELKKDIFDFVIELIPNVEFFVLDKGLEELKKVYKDKPNKYILIKRYLDKLQEIGKFSILKVDSELLKKYEKIDKLLIHFSKNYLIYTNDKDLKSKIKLRNRRVIILKKKGAYIE